MSLDPSVIGFQVSPESHDSSIDEHSELAMNWLSVVFLLAHEGRKEETMAELGISD